jgi:hypothetical protein
MIFIKYILQCNEYGIVLLIKFSNLHSFKFFHNYHSLELYQICTVRVFIIFMTLNTDIKSCSSEKLINEKINNLT